MPSAPDYARSFAQKRFENYGGKRAKAFTMMFTPPLPPVPIDRARVRDLTRTTAACVEITNSEVKTEFDFNMEISGTEIEFRGRAIERLTEFCAALKDESHAK